MSGKDEKTITQTKKPMISAIMSAIVWGSGQAFICKQKGKGFLFFLVQMIFITIELSTGYIVHTMMGMVPVFDVRVHGGFFSKAIWGFLTLGQVKMEDHSIRLMVIGVIAIVILVILAFFYYYVIIDAFQSAQKYEEDNQIVTLKQFVRHISGDLFPQMMLTPLGILFLLVTVLPIICTILVAFTDYSRNVLPPGNLISWVGLENFIKLVNVPIWTQTFLNILGWTLIWATSVSLISYFFGMFQALLLSSIEGPSRKVYQAILILPWAIPSMITLLYLRTTLNGQFGQLNVFLLEKGIITEAIPFLSDPTLAKIVVIVVAVFLSFPSFMLMMLGVFSGADESWYEAANIDGANKIQQFLHITFPYVFTATAPLLIMNFAFNFNGFGIIYFLTDGGPVNSEYQFAGHTDILISWIYDLTLSQQMYGMASVMSILIFAFVGTIAVWNLKRTVSFKNL
ncbi:MAG: sugar ABC transporter permease [Eubacteriales bacterium]